MSEPQSPAPGGSQRKRPTPAEEARQRSDYARQVISGSQLRTQAAGGGPITASTERTLAQDQLIYFVTLGFLLVLGLVLYLIFGAGVASIIFLLLAFALFIGYFLF